MATPANPDWINGRSPLPILFAQVVDHPARTRFLELRRAIPDPAALEETQTILVRCGAISYAVDQLLSRYRLAEEKLAATRLVYKIELETLLDEVMEPVDYLPPWGLSNPKNCLKYPPWLAIHLGKKGSDETQPLRFDNRGCPAADIQP